MKASIFIQKISHIKKCLDLSSSRILERGTKNLVQLSLQDIFLNVFHPFSCGAGASEDNALII